MVSSFLEKVYAGFLGMNIGIRLGAPVEPSFWSYDRIREVYGDITGYIKDFKHFAADDDVNGPVFFLRALDDSAQEPTPQSVAQAWLNYAREGVGLYWWGGFGISTEHTAYLNLKNGIPAPQSGSIRQNGKVLAEQIGGQIFIDTWGLICPGDPQRAARYAVDAASVSHDGEGLYGAAFMAACVAQAFVTEDVGQIIQSGLEQIPANSLYVKVFESVRRFHVGNPDDWRACRQMLEDQWGYDRYPGVCHIIPNAGVCALALYYGAGDFSRTIEIATMCSWDTDCNASNVGTILGVAKGLAGIPGHYRDPLEDELVLSGISGYLNVVDIPSYCKYLAAWAYRLKDQSVPVACTPVADGEIYFDFVLPGSIHSIKYRGAKTMFFRRSPDMDAVEVVMNRATRGQGGRMFYRALWRRADFDDERYMPVFSPTVYPGHQVEMLIDYEKTHGEAIQVTPYVVSALSGKETRLSPMLWRESTYGHTFSFTVPDLQGDMVREVGLHIESASPPKFFDAGRVLLRSLRVSGPASYTLKVGGLPKEFGSVLGFSHNHGAWEVEEGMLHCLSGGHAEAMTGNYFMGDAEVCGIVSPQNGGSHLVGIHVQGAQRGYYGGLAQNGHAVLMKNEHGKLKVLASRAFDWRYGQQYKLCLTHKAGKLSLSVDGQALMSVDENEYIYGMVGYAMSGLGRCMFGDLCVAEEGGKIS